MIIRSGKSPCPHCGIFVKNVNMHIYNQHTERELKTCPVCDYTQTSISRVNKHYRRMHTEMNVTNCGFCGILTKDLNYHLRMAQCDKKKDEKIMYQCDDCEKQALPSTRKEFMRKSKIRFVHNVPTALIQVLI